MRTLVIGLIGQYPFGGVVWDYIQYLTGFRKLGHDVHYLEDTGVWPYDPLKDSVTDDCSYHVGRLAEIMAAFGLGERWSYRNAATGEFFGEGESAARELVRNADLLVGVSTAGWLEDYEIGVRHRMFIDGDPLFTQVRLVDAPDDPYTRSLRAHDSHFTFGLNLGADDCLAPTAGIEWLPTVQPVDLDHWPFARTADSGAFTTVMNWVSYQPLQWNGMTFGQKDASFQDFIELPRHARQRLELAMGQGIGRRRPSARLRDLGWRIVEPEQAIPTFADYRDFLAASRGEWSIAKHGYVAARTGWFSCRTACYLACGRPAVVQDTGWSRHLPAGSGLLGFTTLDECVAALDRVDADYRAQREAARAFAEKHLDAARVCARLLADAGLG